jgi:DNA-directed RNA polymerase subunit M/transcription elongation factor TFIIS
MSTATKKIKRVCKCEHCGNEAEMVVTCSLDGKQSPAANASVHEHKHEPAKVKGTATCTSCGNEADMWVNI